jgi:cation diffusion facilitator CzcD-associated flavoprotein CzcO
VTSATWDETKATWAVDVEDYGTVESEILINAGGILHHPQMPTISGLSSFGGPLLHTARWDSAIDLKGKRVAIIGAGASAVQLLPKIQPLCEDVDIYIRTPSWICPPAGQQASDNKNSQYSEDDKQGFRQNRDSYLEIRKGLESPFNSNFKAFIKGSPEQTGLRKEFEVRMKELIHDEYLQSKLIPKFEVGCRRTNPGEGYLLALQEANVHPIFDPISEIVKEGVTIELENGSRTIREVDVLIAATGFNTSFKPRFPIIGRDSMNLQDKWSSDPVSYLGTGVSGFPNYLMFLGPNTPISNGSVIGKLPSLKCCKGQKLTGSFSIKKKGPLEATSDYFIRILRKVIRERVRSFEIRQEVEQDFDCHTVELMRDMVWTGSCRSWCKLFSAPLLAVYNLCSVFLLTLYSQT